MNAEASALVASRDHGFPVGLGNMLRKENRSWWRTRRWWLLCLMWSVVLNVILATTMKGEMNTPAAAVTFLALAGAFLPIGAVSLGQDSLLRERHSGTAAWVLTKPVGRPAFILAKVIANGLGFAVTGIALPGAIAWVQFKVIGRAQLPTLPGFTAALGLVYLNLLFYLALAFMLATLFSSRGAGLGIVLAVLLGYQPLSMASVPEHVPWLGTVMPWGLVSGFGKDAPLVGYLVMGQPLPTLMPIIATAAWCALFLFVAIWRFSREDF